MTYVVSTQPNPSREELEWAWKFTVFARAAGHCQHCGKQTRLDACHVESRASRPDLEFDPENGVALCRACHIRFDVGNGQRPHWGAMTGSLHTEETKRRIGESHRKRAEAWTPEEREVRRQQTLRQWDRHGRKHVPKPCENCGEMISPRQAAYQPARFCSAACHYAFRTGKPRSGY